MPKSDNSGIKPRRCGFFRSSILIEASRGDVAVIDRPHQAEASQRGYDRAARKRTEHRIELDPRTTLLNALRDHLDLRGTEKGCATGWGAAPLIERGAPFRCITGSLSLA